MNLAEIVELIISNLHVGIDTVVVLFPLFKIFGLFIDLTEVDSV